MITAKAIKILPLLPKSSEMITYILNLNSHWQLRHHCSWRGWTDLRIYCQRRGRREFYWPGRIIRIRGVKQVCSDLLEYSVGSKGTGSELESILSFKCQWCPFVHSAVTLCLVTGPSGAGRRAAFSGWLLIRGFAKSSLPVLLGLLLESEHNSWRLHRQSQEFHLHVSRALVQQATP